MPAPILSVIRALLTRTQSLYQQAQTERRPVAAAYNIFSLLGSKRSNRFWASRVAGKVTDC